MTRISKLFIGCLTLALAAPGGLLGAEACSVRVSVTDSYGKPVTGAHIRIVGDGHTSDLQQGALVPFKCGKYALEICITASGARPAIIEVNVHQMEQIVPVAMKLGAMEAPVPTCSVLGKVASSFDASRIRLLEMFGGYSVDVPVNPKHEFQITNLDCGVYLLLVMTREECVGTKVLRITAATGRVARVDLKDADLSVRGCSSIPP